MTVGERLLPHPIFSITLFTLWQFIAGDGSGGQLLLGVIVAIGLPMLLRAQLAPAARIVNIAAALRLVTIVLYDIVVSNIIVAKRVLGSTAALRPGFFEVKFESSDGSANDSLDQRVMNWVAIIVTMTPGTVSCRVDPLNRTLLVHALHLDDPVDLAASIKTRYEQPLREMLGC